MNENVTIRVLMVEDHVFSLRRSSSCSENASPRGGPGSADFRRAPTVEAGLRLFSGGGPFDLAAVDLMLPDGDGTEVVREIKASSPETPVAVLSSVDDLSGAGSIGRGRPRRFVESPGRA